MARIKQSVVQRDFSIMEIREDFLDADGEEMRARSLRGAQNMRAMTTRVAQARPGSVYFRNFNGAVSATEIRPADGFVFGVVIRSGGLTVISETGATVASFNRAAWGDGTSVWVTPSRERTFFGHPTDGLHVLTFDDGSWTFEPWQFTTAEGGEIAQPYWSFQRNVLIRPSARTGVITITSSTGIFSPDHVGTRIRYGFREVRVTGYISPIQITATVISPLPPSFEVTVQSSGDFLVGEILIGGDTNWQGLLIGKLPGGILQVMTLEFFGGPDVGEVISGPSGSSKVTAKTPIAPLASTIWDEPLMSKHRGFPRSASAIGGRMVFVDFPAIPDLIAISSARDVQDFRVGAADDDAILRQEGDGAPRFLHAINAGDLLLLSDRGCYYVPIRDNGVLTPSSFNAVLFDKRGASEIRPVNVDDGVVFVEANGQTISAALLDGNIYLKWSIRSLTLFHHHLIKSPRGLCGPAIGSPEAEKYLFVVNDDGTLAAMSWSLKLGDENVGFSPWVTDGLYRHVAPIFGSYLAFVDRSINGVPARMLEEFASSSYVDSALIGGAAALDGNLTVNGSNLTVNGAPLTVAQPGVAHLPNRSIAVLDGPYFVGMTQSDGSGVLDPLGVSGAQTQLGLPFISRVDAWPVELIESDRIGQVTVRVIQLSVSVQGTTAFQIVCNGDSRTVGGYSAGALFSLPPELHTKVFRAPVMGRRDHPNLSVVKHIPGPFRILAVGQEVQG